MSAEREWFLCCRRRGVSIEGTVVSWDDAVLAVLLRWRWRVGDCRAEDAREERLLGVDLGDDGVSHALTTAIARSK